MENKQNNASNKKFEIKKNRRLKPKKTSESKFPISKAYLVYCGVILAVVLVIILVNLPDIILKTEIKGAKSQEELNLICQKKDIDCYFQYSLDTNVDDFNIYKVRVLGSADEISKDEDVEGETDGASENVTNKNKVVHIMIQENSEGATDESENTESES